LLAQGIEPFFGVAISAAEILVQRPREHRMPGSVRYHSCGMVFRVTTSGKEQMLYSFEGSP
jgi:hypothetical protein